MFAVVELNEASANSTCPFVGFLHDGAKLRIAVWSPSSSLAYVTDGATDVYYLRDIQDLTSVTRVTTDGQEGELFNGVPDWLYEEEILSSATALWWSPSGDHLAYAVFNESGVRSFPWVHFGDPSDPYVDVRSIRYPKSGTTNPRVAFKLVSIANPGQKFSLLVPDALASGDHYLMQVKWLNASYVSALWMNRLQQISVLAVYNMQGGKPEMAAMFSSKTWLENYPYTASLAGDYIFLRLPNSEVGEFIHLARLPVVEGMSNASVKFLTSGQWEVTGFESVQSKFLLVSTTMRGPETRHLFRVSISTGDLACLTCTAGGTACCTCSPRERES